jgi:hypothetical protein
MDKFSLDLALELRGRLLAELQRNPTFLAYQHIQAVIAALGAQPGQQLSDKEPAAAEKVTKKSPKQGSQQEAILTGAVKYLRMKNERAQSGDILKALTDQGVVVGGQKPSATLSSYLSHSSLFDNIRGQGYGLVEWSQPQKEAPNSGELFGAPKANGAEPLNP